jgi:agmatine deiminase
MIADWNKNHVCFSELLPVEYPDDFNRIKAILKKHDISYSLLKNTKDIWCRDYMPIQINSQELMQFRYEPSYLEEDLNLQSNPDNIPVSNDFNVKKSSLNIDGGNVTCSSSKAILTKRVFKENLNLSAVEVKNELEKRLNCPVFFVDDIKDDMTGHIDGHLRFINEESIVVNELPGELKYWQKSFHQMINKSKLSYTEMPWFIPKSKSKPESAIGSYVNYLQLDNLIFFPVFECEGNKDEAAIRIVTKLFPNHIIEPININTIAENGGLMNCITWTLKQTVN